MIVTGASDGVGAAAARALAARGDRVVVVGRNPDKTAAVARSIDAEHHVADFASLDEVRSLADTLLDRHERIDVLANNAGGIMGHRELTVDGFERTTQVNHLAPFLLTNLLLERIVASRGTVVATSSAAARLFGHIDLDDLDRERGYSPERAYGDAKLANVLMASELERRYGTDGHLDRVGIRSAAFHPGIVATGFAADTTSAMRLFYRSPFRRLAMVSPERGADTLVWLATTAGWPSGAFFVKRKVARTNPQASDAALAAAFWDASAARVGITTH